MTCADLQHHREVLNRAGRSTNAIADRHAGKPNSRSAPTVVTLRAGKSTLGPWFAPRVTTLDPMTAADSTRPSKASRNKTPSRPCTTAKRKPVTRQVSSTPSAWTRVRPRSSASSSTHQVGRSQSWISQRRGRPDDGSDVSAFERVTDEMFADLFTDVGRRSVPPMIVAVVMVLQRIEGCSDREAVDRFAFDGRGKDAAGGLGFDYPGVVHTVLVDMRARLASSARPDRIFEVTLEAARKAGLIGRRRVLDSTPLYDAVATMDTVTLVRSAICGLLTACGGELAGELRGLLRRDDDYAAAGKPACDYDDAAAREELVDALARDAHALLAALEGRELDPVPGQAAELLATVTGQDLEQGAGGVFRIARKVARDRVISTVDPQARHGHKTSARGFDGYKGHIAIDPDSEIITAAEATPGNSGDAEVAESLLGDMLPGDQGSATNRDGGQAAATAAGGGQPAVYGDAAYGSGELIGRLDDAGLYNGIKCQPPAAVKGCFPKDRFTIDLDGKTVTCPAGVPLPIRAATGRHAGAARSGAACRPCPLAAQCPTAREGRTITIGPHEARLAAARTRQQD